MLLYEIWTAASRPYGRWNNAKILQELDKGYRLPLPPSCPGSMYGMMLETWNPDATTRPTFSMLVSKLSDMLSEYQLRTVPETEEDISRLVSIQRSYVKEQATMYESEVGFGFLGSSETSESLPDPDILIDRSRSGVTHIANDKRGFYQPLTVAVDLETTQSADLVPMSALTTVYDSVKSLKSKYGFAGIYDFPPGSAEYEMPAGSNESEHSGHSYLEPTPIVRDNDIIAGPAIVALSEHSYEQINL